MSYDQFKAVQAYRKLEGSNFADKRKALLKINKRELIEIILHDSAQLSLVQELQKNAATHRNTIAEQNKVIFDMQNLNKKLDQIVSNTSATVKIKRSK